MKIPLSIKIGAHDVSVKVGGSPKDLENGPCEIGDVMVAINRIRVAVHLNDNVDIPESMQAETFLHEIVHYLFIQAGYGPLEKHTTALAAGLLQVIRDNNLDFRRPK